MNTDYYSIPYSTIKGGAKFTSNVDQGLALLLFNTLDVGEIPPKKSRTKLNITGNPGGIISMRFLYKQKAIIRGSRYALTVFKNAILIDLELEDKTVCIHFYQDKFNLTGAQSEHHIDEAASYLCDHINNMYSNIKAFLLNELKEEAIEYIRNNCYEIEYDSEEQETKWFASELIPEKYDFCRFLFAAENDVHYDMIVDMIDYIMTTHPDDYEDQVTYKNPDTTMVNHNTSLGNSIVCYELNAFMESYFQIEPRFSCYYDGETKAKTIVLYWNYEPEDYGIVRREKTNYKVSFTIGNAGNVSISGRNKEVISHAYEDLILLFDAFNNRHQ